MDEKKESYDHVNLENEKQRLQKQFSSDWTWESKILIALGLKTGGHKERKTLLSYGCGTGIEVLHLLKDEFCTEGEGWDIDDSKFLLEITSDPRIKLLKRDLFSATDTIPENTFDIVYLRLVVQHIMEKDVRSLLKRCSDLLRSSGFLLVHDADWEQERIYPSTHQFAQILTRIVNYKQRYGYDPGIAHKAHDLFQDLGLENIKSVSISIDTNHSDCIQDLEFVTNVRDLESKEGLLVTQDLWDEATSNLDPLFRRTQIRVLTCGQKPP